MLISYVWVVVVCLIDVLKMPHCVRVLGMHG